MELEKAEFPSYHSIPEIDKQTNPNSGSSNNSIFEQTVNSKSIGSQENQNIIILPDSEIYSGSQRKALSPQLDSDDSGIYLIKIAIVPISQNRKMSLNEDSSIIQQSFIKNDEESYLKIEFLLNNKDEEINIRTEWKKNLTFLLKRKIDFSVVVDTDISYSGYLITPFYLKNINNESSENYILNQHLIPLCESWVENLLDEIKNHEIKLGEIEFEEFIKNLKFSHEEIKSYFNKEELKTFYSIFLYKENIIKSSLKLFSTNNDLEELLDTLYRVISYKDEIIKSENKKLRNYDRRRSSTSDLEYILNNVLKTRDKMSRVGKYYSKS